MNTLNFVSIQVKCPICGASMMDKEQKVDNEQSIKFIVEGAKGKGTLRLSSIYGSYNYLLDMEIADGEVVKFHCPECKNVLGIPELCKSCDAPMVKLVLTMGGEVSFCSRKGCQNHNIGFQDLSLALKKFYQDFGYISKHHHEDHLLLHKDEEKVKTEEEEDLEIIETGAFLQAYCPHCKKTLIESDMLKLKIARTGGVFGYIMLSPYLNVFSSKSTIFLPEEQTVGDIHCFHCDASLMVPEGHCERCSTAIARILVSARTKMIDFYICSKKGCTWHGLSKDDLENIRLEDSVEW